MMKCSMDQNNRGDAMDGPVVSEGGRSPSTLSPGQGTLAAKDGAVLGPLAPGQRWSAARKCEVVLRLMRGEAAELLARAWPAAVQARAVAAKGRGRTQGARE